MVMYIICTHSIISAQTLAMTKFSNLHVLGVDKNRNECLELFGYLAKITREIVPLILIHFEMLL